MINLAIENTRKQLWEVQVECYRDSVRMTNEEVIERARFDHTFAMRATLALVDDPAGFFYKCGANLDGTYRWIGYRYGMEPQEYRSNF